MGIFLATCLFSPRVTNSFEEVPFAIATADETRCPASAITYFTWFRGHLVVKPPSVADGAIRVLTAGAVHDKEMKSRPGSLAKRAFQLAIAAAELTFRIYQRCRDRASDKHSQKNKNNDS